MDKLALTICGGNQVDGTALLLKWEKCMDKSAFLKLNYSESRAYIKCIGAIFLSMIELDIINVNFLL